jgi:hypothetical protein
LDGLSSCSPEAVIVERGSVGEIDSVCHQISRLNQ